ncbi:hypothetical protein DFJ73DRAFT_878200 [Zopfochytrium polystomum]|nr:hypothetical protein DFJ73DRAFT_878200 [Zopfochytrium polystomum]
MASTSNPSTTTLLALTVLATSAAITAAAVLLFQRQASSSSSSSTRETATTSNKSNNLPGDIRVVDLVVYPVKSCAGIRVKTAWVNEFGFAFDRLWIVVDRDGNMLTLREFPKMALIKPTLAFTDPSNETDPDAYSRGGTLTLSHVPTSSSVTIPFRKSFEGAKSVPIQVFNCLVDGVDEGDEAAKWLSKVLGAPARLLVKDPRTRRSLPAKHTPAPEAYSFNPQTSFTDGFPFLLTSTTSLDDVNARLKELSPSYPTLDVLNFRPNIVVAAPPGSRALAPYAEESFKTLAIGSARNIFYVASRCTRCQIPGIDVASGTPNAEVPKALHKFLRSDPGYGSQACFGMNLSHAAAGYFVRVGDPVVVVAFGVHNLKVGMWRPEM